MAASEAVHYQTALYEACARARIDARGAVVLHIRANAVYHLPREGVVARIRFTPAGHDAVLERFTAAVWVTRWLRGHGFPAVEPLDIDQPVTVADHVATFWRYETVTSETGRDTATLGYLMRQLHCLPPAPVPPSSGQSARVAAGGSEKPRRDSYRGTGLATRQSR